MTFRPLAVLGLAGLCLTLAACQTTPASTSTPTTTCGFAAVQTANDLRMSCTISGSLPNTRVDPANAGSTSCNATSFSVFGQTVSTTLLAIYGQNGDDGPARVRVGVNLGPGTHAGRMGKSAGNDCDATFGPIANIGTTFGGTYIALVDKGQQPMCVFQSRLDLSTFNQTLSAGLSADVSGVTRESTSDALQKRLDLEIATQVNKLLQPASVPLPESAAQRNGRCRDGFRTFVGS